MDGTRDTEAIVRYVTERHPAETSASVRAGLDAFISAGFVEDAGAATPPELTSRDQDRYDRSRANFRWLDLVPRATTWEPQQRLKNARVTVVGVGGAGGSAALALAGSGVGRLHCIDRDVVELSNLNRQILFTEADVGRTKIDVALERLRAVNSDISVTGCCFEIAGTADLLPLAEDCDVLLLAADTPAEIRVWTNRACLETNTPWTAGGYFGPLVATGVYVPGSGACWECLHEAQDQRLREAGTVAEDVASRIAAGGHAVVAPSAGIAGQLAAHAAMALITGVPPVLPGRIDVFNLAALDSHFVIDDPRRPDCPACSSN